MRMREILRRLSGLESLGTRLLRRHAWDKRMMQAAGEKRREKDRKQSENASSWPIIKATMTARARAAQVPPSKSDGKPVHPKPDRMYRRRRPCNELKRSTLCLAVRSIG